MTVLWVNLATVFICSFWARYFSAPATTGFVPVKPNKSLIFIAMLCLVTVAGLRNNIGDTYFYIHTYQTVDFTWDYIISNKDIGFGVLQMLLKSISQDPQLLIFVTAFITNILIVITLYKYTRMIEISLYVYITSGMFLVSMNGIRQYLAAAIVFAATKYILDGNWKKYILVVLFASTIHQSALILIPIYFLARTKAWSQTTVLILGSAIAFALGFGYFSNVFFAAIENTQYGNYKDFQEGGANIVRVLVDAVPLVLLYMGRERLREMFPKSDYLVNMALIGFVFMIIATQNWIFARFSIYFGLYQLILISWIVKLFVERNQHFIYYGILVFYFLYHFYEQVIVLRIIYESNFFSL